MDQGHPKGLVLTVEAIANRTARGDHSVRSHWAPAADSLTPREMTHADLRVQYFVAEVKFGVGVTTLLEEYVRFGQGKWVSDVVSPRVGPLPPESALAGLTHRSTLYFATLLDTNLTRKTRTASVVHIMNGLPYFANSLLSHRPVIYTLMQPDPTWLFEGIQRAKRFMNRVLESRWLLKRADALLSISPWVAEWYQSEFGLDSLVVAGPTDLSRFIPAITRPTSESSSLVLLCVGDWDGWNGRKRTHELIQALPTILKILPDARLLLVGLSPQAVGVLRQLANTVGVANFVTFVGKVETSRLVEYYQSASIYLAPSLVEGFYRPITEAFACGVPAVARGSAANVPEVCLSPKQHVIVSGAGAVYDGTPSSLAQAVEDVLRSRIPMRARALEYARKFSPEVVLPRLYSLYRDLAERWDSPLQGRNS